MSDLLDVYLRGAANPPKYLALFDGEEELAPGNGYRRIPLAGTDWTPSDGSKVRLLERTFGPPVSMPWTITHVAVVDGDGPVLAVPLEEQVEVGQEFVVLFTAKARTE